MVRSSAATLAPETLSVSRFALAIITWGTGMAYSYSEASPLAPSPNRTIDCQTLLKDGACMHSGWLRRQSLRNRFRIFAWPQVYVVICGGCVYCYSSEVSKKPASAFSLYGYDRVFRAGEVTEKEATWTFKLVHVSPDYRSYLFSASSEKEMLFWMKLFKQEMLRANGKLSRTQGDGHSCDLATYQDAGSVDSAGSFTSEDYMEIEANIYEDSCHCVLPSDYINQKEEDDSSDEMDRVVITRPDLQDRPPQPPPVPQRPEKVRHGVAVTPQAVMGELKRLNIDDSGYTDTGSNTPLKTAKESQPPTVDRTSKHFRKRTDPDGSSVKRDDEQPEASDFWSSIFFYGDKEMASEIIRLIPEDGVYLVRVNDDKSMVLHVYANQQSRKFKIFQEGKKYTLKKESGELFSQVEDLVYYYYSNPLPSVEVCLTECYLLHPDYQTLMNS